MQQLRANESHGCDVGISSKHCHEMDSSDEEESTQQCTSGSPKTKVPLPEDVVVERPRNMEGAFVFK